MDKVDVDAESGERRGFGARTAGAGLSYCGVVKEGVMDGLREIRGLVV